LPGQLHGHLSQYSLERTYLRVRKLQRSRNDVDGFTDTNFRQLSLYLKFSLVTE
jgi:hypothetical protein